MKRLLGFGLAVMCLLLQGAPCKAEAVKEKLAGKTSTMVEGLWLKATDKTGPTTYKTKPNTTYFIQSYGSWTVERTNMTRWADCQGYTNEEANKLFKDENGANRIQPSANLGALLYRTDKEKTWKPCRLNQFSTNSDSVTFEFCMNDWVGGNADNAGELFLSINELN